VLRWRLRKQVKEREKERRGEEINTRVVSPGGR
jgi:hypothetical protein